MNNFRLHIGVIFRWLLVALLLFAKCYVFDRLINQPALVQWEMVDYLVNGSAAVLLALFACFSPKRYPIFIVLCLTDVWMVINILYYRAYHLFITWHLVSIVQNINGFENSVLPYFSWSLLAIPALTLPAFLCFAWRAKRFNIIEIALVFVLGISLSVCGSYQRWKNLRVYLNDEPFSWEWMNPCKLPQSLSLDISEHEREAAKYIRHHSIIAYPLFMLNDAVCTLSHRKEPAVLSAEEEQELQKLIGPVVTPHMPEGNLLIILLESFESWLLDMSDAMGQPICPALKSYIDNHPVLYVRDVATQIQYGMSGDGQLIVNTGLYPTLEGVACVDYGYNKYPNLAHFYPQSAIVNPCRNVWNQTVVASAYGYKQLVEPQTEDRFEWNDSIVVDQIIHTLSSMPAPACVMGITVSGHIPFDSSPDDIPLADTIPMLFRQYMQTAHYTDRQFGRLLTWADTAEVMQNSVIAITGDHRIFHAWLNDEIREYGLRANLPFGTGQAGCPLIVRAPAITSTRVIEQGNQIDIFPTILDFIGQKDYFWKGMGDDLWAGETGANDAYLLRRHLSDKLIRNNYFSGIE